MSKSTIRCPQSGEQNSRNQIMLTLIRMDKEVIEDYQHMTIIDENMYWMKITHLFS